PAFQPKSASGSSRSSARSTARTRVPRAAPGLVSPLPGKSLKCTVGASGPSRGWGQGAACTRRRRCSMSKRILVVEDQEDLRAILRDFLSASGYTVIEAVDGAESVAKAASERPDLVLMDIQLPVLDGYDATRQIKALPGHAAIPIIAVSSFAMKGDE